MITTLDVGMDDDRWFLKVGRVDFWGSKSRERQVFGSTPLLAESWFDELVVCWTSRLELLLLTELLGMIVKPGTITPPPPAAGCCYMGEKRVTWRKNLLRTVTTTRVLLHGREAIVTWTKYLLGTNKPSWCNSSGLIGNSAPTTNNGNGWDKQAHPNTAPDTELSL